MRSCKAIGAQKSCQPDFYRFQINDKKSAIAFSCSIVDSSASANKFMACNMLKNIHQPFKCPKKNDIDFDYKTAGNFKACHQFQFDLNFFRETKSRKMKNFTYCLVFVTCIAASATLISCEEETSQSEEAPGSSEVQAIPTTPTMSFGRKKREAEEEGTTQNPGNQFTSLGRKKRQVEDDDEDNSDEPENKPPKEGKGPKGKGKGGPGNSDECPPPPPPHCKDQSKEDAKGKIKDAINKGKTVVENFFKTGRKKRQANFAVVPAAPASEEEKTETSEEAARKKRMIHYSVRDIIEEKFTSF